MKPATAATPSDLSPRDLELVLALVRGRTLQEAGRRLGLDTSSVYRAVKKLEQRLGLPLFDRGRQGMAAGELALALAQRAEAIEAQLESARELLQDDTVALSGSLRVSCNDIGLHGLLLPLIGPFVRAHPQLQIELLATNQLARLDRREADIALRGTSAPPEHLVGVKLGVMRSALWASQAYLDTLPTGTDIAAMAWATPDADVNLPDYPSRRWRQACYPDLVPRLRCDGMLAVARAVQAGAAVGVAPYLLMAGQPGLVNLTGHLPEVDVDLWLLTHPDMRHLRRVKAFFDFVRRELVLP
jgi:DNA-binding transcriptional LysR family regulator